MRHISCIAFVALTSICQTGLSQGLTDHLVQPPQLAAPGRGSVAGTLAQYALGPADLVQGAFSLPATIELTSARGAPLVGVAPIYSPGGGLGEWGMGWTANLVITRIALRGEIDYSDAEFSSPWGRLEAGTDGDYYPSGYSQLVRLERTNLGWLAHQANGTIWVFDLAVQGGGGDYLWHATRVESRLGDVTTLEWVPNSHGRLFLAAVTYGARGYIDSYRVELTYALLGLPFDDYGSGVNLALDRRVERVDINVKQGNGNYLTRYYYELQYAQSPYSPAFYLVNLQKKFPGGDVEPAISFEWNVGDEALAAAHLEHIPKLDALSQALSGFSPDWATPLDIDQDGLVDLEYGESNLIVHQGETSFAIFPQTRSATAHPACWPSGAQLQPRHLCRMRPDGDIMVVATRPNSLGYTTQLSICAQNGELVHGEVYPDNWRLDATHRVVDLDRDERPDLLRVARGEYRVKQNTTQNGIYSFADDAVGSLTPIVTPVSAWAHDLNGDGVADLVVRTTSGLYTWPGLGHRRFAGTGHRLVVNHISGSPVNIGANRNTFFRDVNRDGLQDLIVGATGTGGGFRLYMNRLDRFEQVLLPNYNSSDPYMSPPVVLDLRGDGRAEVVFRRGGEGWGVSLDRPGTGLMAAMHDGHGNYVEFEYDTAPSEPGIGHRPSVLAATVHNHSGLDSVRVDYAYDGAVAHSIGQHLVGFGRVQSLSRGHYKVEEFLNDDNTSGRLLRATEHADVWPDVERVERRTYDARTHLGLDWHRPRLVESGWRRPSDGHEILVQTESVKFQREFCSTLNRTTSPEGTLDIAQGLVAESLVPSLPPGLHCTAGSINVLGQHVKSELDVKLEQGIARNGLGQVTSVTSKTKSGTLLVQSIDYDSLQRVRRVIRPSGSWVEIDYSPSTGLLDVVRTDLGITTNVTDRSPVSDLLRGLRMDRGATGPTTRFEYDSRQRLWRTWQDLGASSLQTPLVEYLYRDTSDAGPGVVVTRSLVDALSSSYSESADLRYGDGSVFGGATMATNGWVLDRIHGPSRGSRTSKTFMKAPLPSSMDVMVADYSDLNSGVLYSDIFARAETSDFGPQPAETRMMETGVWRSLTRAWFLDSDGLVLTENENGKKHSTVRRNASGNVTSSMDGGGEVTKFEYDVLGRIVAVQLPGSERHEVRYDGNGRVKETWRKSIGRVAHSFDSVTGLPRSKDYYDKNGQLGRSVAFSHDTHGRVTSEHHTLVGTGQSREFVHEYDGGGQPHQLGLLTALRSNGHNRTIEYDVFGRPSREVVDVGAWREVERNFTYFEGGQVATAARTVRELPGRAVVESVGKAFTYDGSGRLSTLDVNGQSLLQLDYDSRGRMNVAHLPVQGNLARTFDPSTRAANGYWLSAPTMQSGAAWRLGDRGLIDSEDVLVNGTAWNKTFEYDERRFLMEASASGGLTEQWTYDRDGLMLSASDSAGARSVQLSNGLPTSFGSVNYSFDTQGRVTARNQRAFSYGAQGKISEAVVPAAAGGTDIVTYLYDQAGQRVLKSRNGSPEEAYLFGGYLSATGFIEPIKVAGQLVGYIDNGVFEYTAADVRGTIVADSNGTPRAVSPYGVRAQRPNISRALDYIGRGYDPDLQAVRTDARDYDPYLGRFLQPDPLFFENPALCAERPEECNLYSYAAGDPVNHVDPSGLSFSELHNDISTAATVAVLLASRGEFRKAAMALAAGFREAARTQAKSEVLGKPTLPSSGKLLKNSFRMIAETAKTVAPGLGTVLALPAPEPPPELGTKALPVIPEGATTRLLTPHPGEGSQYGIEYSWSNTDGVKERFRIHGPDGTAPEGSNSREGPTYRRQVGNRYMDDQGDLYPRNVHKEKSPHYDADAANRTHIPFKLEDKP